MNDALSRQTKDKYAAIERELVSHPTNMHEAPAHQTVGSMVNLLNNDMSQLIDEIRQLRAQLTPILADRDQEKQGGSAGMPVRCQVAAELGDVFQKLSEARRLIYMTIADIDL